MKSLALTVSITVNLALLAVVLTRYDRPPSPVAPPPPAPIGTLSVGEGKPAAALPSAPAGTPWGADYPNDLAKLRSLGASPGFIAAVSEVLIRRSYSKQRAQLLYPKGLHRWSPESARLTPEIMNALHQLGLDVRETARRQFGSDYDVAFLEESPLRMLKWGDLSPGEVTTVRRLLDDYGVLQSKIDYGANASESGWKAEYTLDTEFERDLRQSLPGERANDFITFNSPLARRIQEDLSRLGLEVDETLYRRFYAASLELHAEYATHGAQFGAVDRVRSEAGLYRTMFGDEAALGLAKARYEPFAPLDRILSSNGQSAATRSGLLFEYLEAFSAIDSYQRTLAATPTVLAAKSAEAATRLHNAIARVLTGNDLQKFETSDSGRIVLRIKGGR